MRWCLESIRILPTSTVSSLYMTSPVWEVLCASWISNVLFCLYFFLSERLLNINLEAFLLENITICFVLLALLSITLGEKIESTLNFIDAEILEKRANSRRKTLLILTFCWDNMLHKEEKSALWHRASLTTKPNNQALPYSHPNRETESQRGYVTFLWSQS